MVLGVIGLIVLVPLVAVGMAWALTAGQPPIDLVNVAELALICAVVIGPALVQWAIERGRASVIHMMVAGALVGLVPPILAVLSALVGFVAQGGVDYAAFVFKHGASIPWYGTLRWTTFGRLVIECAAIGAMSAAMVTPLVRQRRAAAASL
jgi:hypothetical protein